MRRFAVLLILAILYLPSFVAAQPGDPGGDPDVPLTGIEFLLGGGALLGLRKILGQFKSSKKQ